ncbi:hypothetical protein IT411_00375 [Candidatus Peregrinibacteria bacterium]|nr:hypothetical protein [Candidatus Peregrinibacteria bacterium]
MNKSKFVLALVLTAFMLAGCQDNGQPEHPLNTDGRKSNSNQEVKKPMEEVLPVLKVTKGPDHSELKLRSQTSRYLNPDQSVLEITLSSSQTAFCKNESPALQEGEAELKITVKGQKAIVKEDLALNKDLEINAVYKTSAGEIMISGDQFKSLNISDLNAAILRGNLQISAKDFAVEGEYFTAICK